MSLLLSILVFLIVAGVIWWCANQLIAAFGIPAPIGTVVLVVLILLLLFAFLDMTGIMGGLHLGRLN